MARNVNLTKLKKQGFRRKRGGFKPLSDQSSLDQTFVDNGLRRFWSQHTAPRTMGVSRAQAPEMYKGFVEYRKHIESVALEEQFKMREPMKWERMQLMFPGVTMVSAERQAVEDQLKAMMEPQQVPHEHVMLWKTQNNSMRMFFTPDRKRFYLVEQRCSLVRVSKNYVSKDSVLRHIKMQAISWRTQHLFHLPTTDPSSHPSG